MHSRVLANTSCFQTSLCRRTIATSLLKQRYKIPIKRNEDGTRVRVNKHTGEEWISTIGLEVHAQIATRSKLFSGAATNSRAPVNTQVALLDASIPGTLPVLNRECVEAGLKTALALRCTINEVSTFDRKHYFYSDLPSGYQITQQRHPIAKEGRLDFQVMKSSTVSQTYNASAGIVQLQLEQDSGKSLHDADDKKSLIDLNRCGTGLMEIVFKPDIFDGEESASLIKELSLILQCLETCTCQMEEGALRVDANISVRRPGEPLGVRTELKNLNSIKSVVHGIEYEIERQITVLSEGGTIENETRSYDVSSKKTMPLRDKEVKQDYRFMPEPNLPPLRIQMDGPSVDSNNIICLDEVRKGMPELPEETRQKLVGDFKLPLDFSYRLVNEPELLNFFYDAVQLKPKNVLVLASMVLSVVEYLRNKTGRPLDQLRSKPKDFVRASDIKADNLLTSNLIRKAFLIFEEGHYENIDDVIDAKGWLQTFRDPKVIDTVVQSAIEENEKQVRRYLRGKEKSFEYISQSIFDKALDVDMMLVQSVLRKRLDLLKSQSQSGSK